MPGILASAVVLASLLVGQPPVRPIPTDCCAESSVLPGFLSVRFRWDTSPERAEEITTELGVMVRWITSGTLAPVTANICAPTGQEAATAAMFETYREVTRTWVWGPGCDHDEPRCGCCPSGYFCADLPPCDPHFEVPDGDADGFPDRCDTCTDSDGDLFGNPDFNNQCPSDNCPDAFNPDQIDFDTDGLGDACDRQLTICHDPPGPRIGTQTIDINEGAFSSHQSHGDTLGPCDIEIPCNVPFTRVLHTWSGIRTERFEVIDDEDAWCDLWSQLYGWYVPPLPCDTTLVDFDTEVAILAAIGGRLSGCYNVNVACIRKPAGAGNISVDIIERQPGPACICSLGVVFPLEVVKIPRFVTRRTIFKKRIEILDCEY